VDFARHKWQRVDLDPHWIKALMLATKGNPGHLSNLLDTLMSTSSEWQLA
jgi:hypothetical protein